MKKKMLLPELQGFKDDWVLKFNFKRVFLKTIFFETMTTITRKVFGESS